LEGKKVPTCYKGWSEVTKVWKEKVGATKICLWKGRDPERKGFRNRTKSAI